MAADDHMNPGLGADHPFLAFVNSVDDDGKSRKQNLFTNGAQLINLLRNAGLQVPPHPPSDGQVADLLTLREAAYLVLSARAARRDPQRSHAMVLEAALKTALADSTFGFAQNGLQLSPGPLDALHDNLALSLFDLITSDDFPRLSECRRCTRLFIDRGRGRGRRWCDMARCGNRAKAESFRARKRAVKPD